MPTTLEILEDIRDALEMMEANTNGMLNRSVCDTLELVYQAIEIEEDKG